jgi:hypothetical protein
MSAKLSIKSPLVTFVLLGFFLMLITAFKRNEVVTREQAIILAERFVINNGYTSLPADTSKLSYELFDAYNESINSMLKERHNMLHPKAFCISEDDDRWDVGFLSTSINVSKLDSISRQTDLSGRAIIVYKNGKEIRIAHKDPLFSRFEKL